MRRLEERIPAQPAKMTMMRTRRGCMMHGERRARHSATDESENCKRREFAAYDIFCQAISVCDEFCFTLSAQGAVIVSHAVKRDHLIDGHGRYLGTSGLGSND